MVYTNYTFMVMTGDGLWHCFTHMNYETLQIMEWDKPSTNWCRIYSIHRGISSTGSGVEVAPLHLRNLVWPNVVAKKRLVLPLPIKHENMDINQQF